MKFWFYLTLLSAGLVCFSYFVFEKYLFMLPCEQCVYVRLGFSIVAVGCFIAFIRPYLFSIFGYIISGYGIYFGLKACLKLNEIHNSLSSKNPFKTSPCRLEPTFPFDLPLAQFDVFRPKALCGLDAPVIPKGANLDFFQTLSADIYKEGWYLLPQFKIMTMSQLAVCFFILIILLLFYNLLRHYAR